MERDRERLLGQLRVAVGHGDGVLLVETEHDLGSLVAEIVDETVVESAVAGSRIERDERQLEAAQQLGDGIAAPGHFGLLDGDRWGVGLGHRLAN